MTTAMKILITLALSCLLNLIFSTAKADAPAAQSPTQTPTATWVGTIKLWEAELCKDPSCIALPKLLGPVWNVSLKVADEKAPGYHAIGRGVFTEGDWSVTILVARMNPTDGSVPYIATQTTLKDTKHGTIAQCARYDAVGAFTFLPPGSCSGQLLHNGSLKLLGVSLYAPIP